MLASEAKAMDIHHPARETETNVECVEAALRAIVGWLLSEPVLRPAEAGAGVVNWLSTDGSWDGLYPEICGYHLQFAAYAAPAAGNGDDAPFQSAAAGVAAWLDAVGGAGAEPLTLYHRDMAESDWRNQCLFAFDLAIILRGLAAAEARWPGLMPAGVSERYAASLSRIVENRRLASHRLRPGASSADIPVKWSTTPGVHHVKAAAALAELGRPGMTAMIEATLRDEAALFAREGEMRMRELHPFLYFVEGWLMLWSQTQDPHALANAGRAFGMVLGQVDPRSGVAPPVADAHDAVTRSDVLAQVLRAGLVLEAAGQLMDEAGEMWRPRRRALQAALLQRISPEGGIIFDCIGGHRNAWASMFGWQALQFLRDAQAGALDPIAAAAALI
ncbi:MAG: hypothetical protein M3Y41_09685 [Pseudomonadota bacterium]|nr:hypothetical protein [Pseudomonadota bacterium]